MEPFPHSKPVPFVQTHPARGPGAAAHLTRQIIPTQARLEKEENACERGPVIQRLASKKAKPARLRPRQKRLHQGQSSSSTGSLFMQTIHRKPQRRPQS